MHAIYMKRARGKGLGMIGVSDSRGVASMQMGEGEGLWGWERAMVILYVQ
jgi:hypothetical protein